MMISASDEHINDIESNNNNNSDTIQTPLLSSYYDHEESTSLNDDETNKINYDDDQPSLADITITTAQTSSTIFDKKNSSSSSVSSSTTSSSHNSSSPSTSRLTGTKRLLQLAGPHKLTLLLGCIILLLRLPFSLSIPHFVAETLGSLGDGDYDGATWNIVFLMVAGTIDAVLDFWCIYLFGAAQNRIVRELRVDTFAAILKQEIGFFDSTNSGDLISRLTSDTGVMSSDLTWFFRFSIESFVRIAGISIYMILSNPTLAGAALAIIPIIAYLNKKYGDWLSQNAKDVQDSLASATSIAQESLSCIRTVVAFAGENVEVKRYKERIDENYRLNQRQLIATGVYFMVLSTFLVNTCVQGALLFIGAKMIREGHLDTTTLLQFMLYQGQLQSYTLQLFQSYSSLMKSSGAGDHVFALLDRHTKRPGTGHGSVARHIAPDNSVCSENGSNNNQDSAILSDKVKESQQQRRRRRVSTTQQPRDNSLEFSNVAFSYPTRLDRSVVDGLSLKIPSGTTMALVGPSGCGKSTIVNLLERFYDPFQGSVLVGGVDLRNIDIKEHRRSVGIVTQDPTLFSGTILSNITYPTPPLPHISSSSPETIPPCVIHAATLANAHSFITSFPLGYHTPVGERGIQLSGGQKQRLCIARAIYKQPKILLLDEATSALDSESERCVQEALDRLLLRKEMVETEMDDDREGEKEEVEGDGDGEMTISNTTAVVIAHRLQTVRMADCIAVMMPGGRGVVEMGRHEELMALEGGEYRKMVLAAGGGELLPEI